MTTGLFAGYTINVTDDEYAVMPEGDELERSESLARYHEIAERDLAELFPGATISLSWGEEYRIYVDCVDGVIRPEDESGIIETVRYQMERIFENGGW